MRKKHYKNGFVRPAVALICLLCVFQVAPAFSEVFSFAESIELSLDPEIQDYKNVKPRNEQFIASVKSLQARAQQANNVSLVLQSAVLLADVLMSNGDYENAQTELKAVLSTGDLEDRLADKPLALLYYHHARLNQQIGSYITATEYYKLALAKVKKAGSRLGEAIVSNDLGSVLLVNEQVNEAIDSFRLSYNIFTTRNNEAAATSAGTNLLRASIGVSPEPEIRELLKRISTMITSKMLRVTSMELLSLSDLYRTAQRQYQLPVQLRRESFELAQRALAVSEKTGDLIQQSYAMGYLGRLLEDESRIDDAIAMTEAAIFRAQEGGSLESLYQWQWQLARLLRSKQDAQGAIDAYKASVANLSKIHSQLIAHVPGAFQKKIAPVYYGLLDLLLQQTASLKDKTRIDENLLEIHALLEQFKISEVEDYYRNDCVIQKDESSIANLAQKPAVFYPIVLDDRMEILVSLPSGLKIYSVPVKKRDLVNTVRALRVEIEKPGQGEAYQQKAKKLYQWLVAPVKQDLEAQQLKTLVFIPDGSLRTIPMSVLYDGKQHLIEQYAIATTPGLSLTNVEPMRKSRLQFLVNGLTEGVQGFNPLPFVDNEISSINEKFTARIYKDKTFSEGNVEVEMKKDDYNIIHVATHGQFSSNHNESFLLTYNDKITMDDLERSVGLRRFVNKPLDLLVLSACQTAAGDDRAALGLAGVAIKAGARGAVATLWFINDKATASLMTDFYSNLSQKKQTKAEALQTAQINLLNNPRYRHPAYWAPFLMIGNWL